MEEGRRDAGFERHEGRVARRATELGKKPVDTGRAVEAEAKRERERDEAQAIIAREQERMAQLEGEAEEAERAPRGPVVEI